MKITFQNPTQGPLITVSFDDEVTAVAKAFSLIGASRVTTAANNGLATLRNAAQFAQTAPGITSGGTAGGAGVAGAVGPLALIGVLFATGDAPQRKPTTEKNTQHLPSPAELRCLSNPYDSSVECATMRSVLTALPFLESPLNTPNAARASAAFATTSSVPMTVDLPTSATQFAADVLAHIEASDGKRHAVPLSADEKQDLIALAQKVATGELSDFDLVLWEGQSPAVKAMALQLYPRINAIMQGFPEHIRSYLDLVVETIVQPPLEMEAT